MNGSWLGYREQFVVKMMSLRLSLFEKVVFVALMLVLGLNVIDAFTRIDQVQTTAKVPAAQADTLALQNDEPQR